MRSKLLLLMKLVRYHSMISVQGENSYVPYLQGSVSYIFYILRGSRIYQYLLSHSVYV